MAVDTHTVTLGQGPPILLLHGFTGDTTTMLDLAQRLEGQGRRVLMDIIGHGRSAKPTIDRYDMSLAVDQVKAVTERLGAQPVVVGYSMGARLALCAAVAGVEMRSLVAIGGRAGIVDPTEREARRKADEALAVEIERRGIEWFVDYWAARPFAATQRRLGAEHLEAARRQRLRNSAHAMAASLRGMGVGTQDAIQDRLGDIAFPVLAVVGEQDVVFRAAAEELASGSLNCRIEVVSGAGHAAHLEAPRATAELVRAFLA